MQTNKAGDAISLSLSLKYQVFTFSMGYSGQGSVATSASISGMYFCVLSATWLPEIVNILHMSTYIYLMKSGLHFSMAPRRSAFRTTALNSISWLSNAPIQRLKGLPTELTESPQWLHIQIHLNRVICLLKRKSKIKLRTWIRFWKIYSVRFSSCLPFVPKYFLFYLYEPTTTKNVKAITIRFRCLFVHSQLLRVDERMNELQHFSDFLWLWP